MKTRASTVLIALVGLAALAYGQTIDARTWSDPWWTRAARPSQCADIEITNMATGAKTTTESNADGQYRFNNIPIGLAYNLSASAAGFSTAEP